MAKLPSRDYPKNGLAFEHCEYKLIERVAQTRKTCVVVYFWDGTFLELESEQPITATFVAGARGT